MSRLKKILLFGFSLLSILLLGTGLLLGLLLFHKPTLDAALKLQEKYTEYAVTVADFQILDGIYIFTDVTVQQGNAPLFSATKLKFNLDILSLLQKPIQLFNLEAEGVNLVLDLTPRDEEKKTTTTPITDPLPFFLIESLAITNSLLTVSAKDSFTISVAIDSLNANNISDHRVEQLKLLSSVVYTDNDAQHETPFIKLDNFRISGGLDFSNNNLRLIKVQAEIPDQDLIITHTQFPNTGLILAGDMAFTDSITGEISHLLVQSNEKILLDSRGSFRLKNKSQRYSAKIKLISDELLRYFTTIPPYIGSIQAEATISAKRNNSVLRTLEVESSFSPVTLTAPVLHLPAFRYDVSATGTPEEISIDSMQFSFHDDNTTLADISLQGTTNALDYRTTITADVNSNNIQKLFLSMFDKKIGQEKKLSAKIDFTGTPEAFAIQIPELRYADSTLTGKAEYSATDCTLLLSGENFYALDLYQFATMSEREELRGILDDFKIQGACAHESALGVTGEFNLAAREFHFSNSLSDSFPFNIIFLPIKTVGRVLSSFPTQLIPAGLRNLSNATGTALDELQTLVAKKILIAGTVDGSQVNLEKALFTMSGIAPDIEIPGTIDSKSLRINSGIFLVGNKIPLPLRGSHNAPTPDIVQFTSALIKGVLLSPLNTVSSVGNFINPLKRSNTPSPTTAKPQETDTLTESLAVPQIFSISRTE